MSDFLIYIGQELFEVGWVLIKFLTVPILVVFVLSLCFIKWHERRLKNR